jgi:hypothetical protein
MKTIQGPAIFLAQFAGDEAPFDTLDHIAAWAAGLGYKGVQIPSWDGRLFDLAKAAESRSYCDDVKATLDRHGLVVSELSTHLQGQLVAVHPAYDSMFDGFAAPEVRGNPEARQKWAVEELHHAAKASRNLGLANHATFSGALAWPYFYPWPQRPAGLVDTAFDELAKRWRPIPDAFDEAGVNLCFEIHPHSSSPTTSSASRSGRSMISPPRTLTTPPIARCSVSAAAARDNLAQADRARHGRRRARRLHRRRSSHGRAARRALRLPCRRAVVRSRARHRFGAGARVGRGPFVPDLYGAARGRSRR